MSGSTIRRESILRTEEVAAIAAAAVQAAPAADASPAPSAPLASVRQVAYHVGPPELFFGGRYWLRGAPQEVTDAEWGAMQARADFAPFQFRSA